MFHPDVRPSRIREELNLQNKFVVLYTGAMGQANDIYTILRAAKRLRDQENISIVPLYYAAERPVVMRDGQLIMVDDDRMPINEGEEVLHRKVRFRTLGCYPLTGAIESEADTLEAIIREMLLASTSEREGRVIDRDTDASMEQKKKEGYF
ncbi:MAG TPA: hypothetical protein P5227_06365 [Emcibacteraceae bacterium]|nr:hypothetical protein [Emcibacteraceae bacterium]